MTVVTWASVISPPAETEQVIPSRDAILCIILHELDPLLLFPESLEQTLPSGLDNFFGLRGVNTVGELLSTHHGQRQRSPFLRRADMAPPFSSPPLHLGQKQSRTGTRGSPGGLPLVPIMTSEWQGHPPHSQF